MVACVFCFSHQESKWASCCFARSWLQRLEQKHDFEIFDSKKKVACWRFTEAACPPVADPSGIDSCQLRTVHKDAHRWAAHNKLFWTLCTQKDKIVFKMIRVRWHEKTNHNQSVPEQRTRRVLFQENIVFLVSTDNMKDHVRKNKNAELWTQDGSQTVCDLSL